MFFDETCKLPCFSVQTYRSEGFFSSTAKMPSRISAPPHKASTVVFSPPNNTAVIKAKTGSRAKMSAVRVGVVYCCAQVCRTKARAVANKPVRTMANIKLLLQ